MFIRTFSEAEFDHCTKHHQTKTIDRKTENFHGPDPKRKPNVKREAIWAPTGKME